MILAVLFLRTEATSEDQQQHAVSMLLAKLCSMAVYPTKGIASARGTHVLWDLLRPLFMIRDTFSVNRRANHVLFIT